MSDFLGSGTNRFGIKPPTISNYLAAKDAKNAKPSGSFVDRLGKDAHSAFTTGIEHPVSWAFDKLLRPMYGSEQYIDTALIKRQGLGAGLHAAKEGFWNGKQISGSKLLSDAGALKGHGILRSIAGLGIDVAADPLTYLTGGTTAIAKSAEHAALLKSADVALNTDHTLLAGKNAKAAAEGLKFAADHLKMGGKGYSVRSALAAKKAEVLTKVAKGAKLSDKETAQLSALGSSALKEHRAIEKFAPHYSVKIPFTGAEAQVTPTEVLGHRIVPALPKLSNIANKSGVIGSLAKHWQNMFITPAGDTAASHQLAISERHIAESDSAQSIKRYGKLLTDRVPGLNKMSEDQQLAALHPFEVPDKGFKAVVPKGKGFVLNPAYVQKLIHEGRLTPGEAKFVHAYHAVGQDMAKRDAEWGVHYDQMGKQGRIYVPHQFKLDTQGVDMPTFAQVNKLTEAGFQKKAETSKMSLKQLKEGLAAGDFPDLTHIETNPLHAIATRAMVGARKRASTAVVDALAGHLGASERLVDAGKLSSIVGKKNPLLDALAEKEDLHTTAMANAHKAEQTFLANHEKDFVDRAAQQEAKIRSVKFGKVTRAKPAILRNAQIKLEKMQAQHASETAAIAKGEFKPLQDHLGQHLDEAQAHAEDMKHLNTEIKKLSAAQKQVLKGTRNPAYKNMSPISGLKDQYGHNVALPREIAHSIGRFKQIANGEDSAIRDLMGGYRKLLANWKIAVTSVNPGYRIRYSLANYVAMWVKGMGAHQVGTYSLKAASIIKKAAEGDSNAQRILNEAEQRGALFGVFKGDVNTAGASLAHRGDTAKALLRTGHPIAGAVKGAQNFTIYFDNLDHLSFYLWNREAKHMTADAAAQQVKEALFDYTDLTPFEQRTMKSIAPFYTWMRKNIPFQLKQMVENPGRQATYAKAGIESQQAAGGDKGSIVPGYIANNLAFKVPFGKNNYYTTSAGVTDLRAFEGKSGLEEKTIGSLNPIFKTPMELIANRNTFTGQPISDPTTHAYAPVSNAGRDLIQLLHAFHVPGTETGTTSRVGPGGKHIYGPGANPYAAYLEGQVPWANYLLVNGPGSLKRTTRGIPPETSQLGGIQLTHVDPRTQKEIASINLQNQVKSQIAKLRDNRVIPPAKAPKNKKQQLIDQMLFKHLGVK
jgi:hypothetical protein